ncbi:MAG TPA: hypothetical protein VLE73_05125 [Candidatus Saccharimonadales bacterium]|nr:hypothetical protein [Candidatus Saccharimonadales bacterium]
MANSERYSAPQAYRLVSDETPQVAQLFNAADYGQILQKGWLDQFYRDPQSGEDALRHILVGEVKHGEHGTYSTGFHHEPSGRMLWDKKDAEGKVVASPTYVDRNHEGAGEGKYAEYPYEPYVGKVAVGGVRKFIVQRNADGTPSGLTPAKTDMFPKEFDPYMVVKATVEARDKRNREKDKLIVNANGVKVIRTEGTFPLVDGTPMRIRLILDADTGKIKTAMPVITNKPGLMKLSQEEADRHAFGV